MGCMLSVSYTHLDVYKRQLSADTMAELAAVLDALDAQPPKGLVIRSGKPTGFIVGADVNEFAELNTPEQGRALVARGWNLFNRLAAVRYPTLALIQGHCLGGGLEPVSYTHLDVYKRQRFPWQGGARQRRRFRRVTRLTGISSAARGGSGGHCDSPSQPMLCLLYTSRCV